jgi:hypothetical protein
MNPRISSGASRHFGNAWTKDDKEDHEQYEAQLPNKHPWIRHPDAKGGRFAEERDVPQTGDLAVIEILAHQEI